MLVDTHTHVWGADTAPTQWKHEVLPPGWEGPFTDEDLLECMDDIGVDEAVLLTTPLYGRGPGANAYTRQALEGSERLYGVGILDPMSDRPGGVETRIDEILGHDRMIGIRIHARLAYESFPEEITHSDWILRPGVSPFWEHMASRDEAVYVFAERPQLEAVEELLSRYPDLTIVLDHLGSPDVESSPTSPPWNTISRLTSYDVYVKLSAVPRTSSVVWPYEDVHPFVVELLEQFGASRLMLGSDYPFMHEHALYEQCLSWVSEVDSLSGSEVESIRSGTFRSLVG